MFYVNNVLMKLEKKSISVSHHINSIQKKKPTIILIDSENTIDKIQVTGTKNS